MLRVRTGIFFVHVWGIVVVIRQKLQRLPQLQCMYTQWKHYKVTISSKLVETKHQMPKGYRMDL